MLLTCARAKRAPKNGAFSGWSASTKKVGDFDDDDDDDDEEPPPPSRCC
jgi:hypothetical protein